MPHGDSLAYVSPRRRRFAVATVGIGVVSALFAAEACLAPTQLTLVIETDVPCPELKGVAITVSDRPEGAESKGFVTAETSDCQAGGRVGTLVLTPSDSGRAAVVVVAGVTRPARECTAESGYEGCIVARRLVSFIDHTALVVPVRLEVDCLDVPCNAISTCSKGKCVSSETSCDGTDCSKFGVTSDGGIAVVEDAPTSNDATLPPDAPADAPGFDAGADALDEAGLCARGQPVKCGASTCMPGQVCCVDESDAGSEYCTSTCTVTSTIRQHKCRGPENCQEGQICCRAPSFPGTYCVTGTTCTMGGGVVCNDECGGCSGGQTCTQSFWYVKTCQ